MMRYPGGKLKLQKRINPIIRTRFPESIPPNPIFFDQDVWEVCEPFTGGGGSLINMAKDFPLWNFRINDLNPEMYTFWRYFISMCEDDRRWEDFTGLFESEQPPTVERHREIFGWLGDTGRSDLDRAYRVLYLNKTSFNGIVTKCLPMGGKKQKGRTKVGDFFKPENIIEGCAKARDLLKGRILSIDNLPCGEFTAKYHKTTDFLYADPPYVKYGKGWYGTKFALESLKNFRSCLNGIKRWCLSEIDEPQIRSAFQTLDEFESLPIKHTSKSAYGTLRSADGIKIAHELLVFPFGTIAKVAVSEEESHKDESQPTIDPWWAADPDAPWWADDPAD